MIKVIISLLSIFVFTNVIANDVIDFESCKYEGSYPTLITIAGCSETKVCSGPVMCKASNKIETYEAFCKPFSNGECPNAGECFKQYLTGENFYVEKAKVGSLDFEEPPFENLPNGYKPVNPHPHTFDKPGTDPSFKKQKTKKERSKSF